MYCENEFYPNETTMNNSLYQNYYDYLSEEVMTPFYNDRLNNLNNLRLKDVLKRKNPYLFKAKNLELAGDLFSKKHC